MLYRHEVEADYRKLYDKYGFGTTVWSPLHMGLLSGKYNDGTIPPDSRFGRSESFKGMGFTPQMGDEAIEQRKKMFSGLKAIADEIG